MTIQLSVACRNALLNALEATIGTSAVVKLRSGPQPANCAAADSGTVIATFSLASDWMDAASSGAKTFSSVPLTDGSADNSGTMGHFRVYDSTAATCGMQGSVSVTAGGGDMTFDAIIVTAGQSVSMTSWTVNMAAHV